MKVLYENGHKKDLDSRLLVREAGKRIAARGGLRSMHFHYYVFSCLISAVGVPEFKVTGRSQLLGFGVQVGFSQSWCGVGNWRH